MTITYSMTAWQKKQAMLLYYFTSIDYIKELKEKVKLFRNVVEGTLKVSQREDRDKYLRDARWGNRNTSENWSNNGWAYIADFDLSISKQIADRAFEIYRVTDASFFGRGVSEYSLLWMSPDEQKEFEQKFSDILEHANYLDLTVDRSSDASGWDDFEFTMTWEAYSKEFEKLPKFQVRTDICIETGQIPPRTGVYVPVDDPFGSLQFAWCGNSDGRLLDCTTFNELGEAALLELGRGRLWKNGKAMQTFVSKRLDHPDLINDPFFNGSPSEESAPSLVASSAFVSHPAKWFYVEIIDGEFEPFETETTNIPHHTNMPHQERSFQAGTNCQNSGYYFTPAKSDSRRFFSSGQTFPEIDSTYGKTIWQWDEIQE